MKLQPIMICLLAGIVLAGPGTLAAVSTVNEQLKCPQPLLDSTAADGRSLVKSMFEKTKQIKAYSLDTVLCTYKGKKSITETGKLYFKNPNLIRFECINAGKRSGAIVVRQSDGKIKGKMGGALSGIKVTLSPDSKLLKSANEFSILESDLNSLLAVTMDKVDSNNSCRAGTLPGSASQIVELIDNNGLLLSRMLVDQKYKLPEDWSLFKDNSLFSTARFANLKIVADLPDSTFSLERPEKQEAEVLIASQRSANMTLAEYKLQLDMDRRQERAELLAAELGLFKRVDPSAVVGGSVLEGAKLMIVEQSNAISAIKLDKTQGNYSWKPGSKEKLIIAASQIELLLSALEPVFKYQDSTEIKATVDHAETARQECIFACRAAVSSLIELGEQEQPNYETFECLKADLGKSAGALLSLP